MCLIAPTGEVKTGWMARAPSPSLEADIGAALDWWREAGVDAAYVDEATGWLADPESQAKGIEHAKPAAQASVPAPEAEARIGGPSAHWPQDLTTFHQWWLTEPSLDEGGLAPRVAPSGEAGADLMILVAMPEESDHDTLLAGRQGALLERFLRAAGLSTSHTYFATVLPRHTPLPDWAGLARQGMHELLAHHIALARPKRLVILGRDILPLCGHDPSQGPAALSFFNHEGGRVPALAEVGLDRLLDNAQSRARLWKRWLDWTDGTEWQRSAVDTGE